MKIDAPPSKNIKTAGDAVNYLKRIAYEGHDTCDKIMGFNKAILVNVKIEVKL